MLSSVMDAFDDRKYSISVFLDFNCVPHSILLRKVKVYKVSDSSIQLLNSYLERGKGVP